LSESSGEEKHRINRAAMWRVGAGKLTRLGEIDTFRYPVATAAWTNDGKWLAVAANSGELNLYRVEAKGATTRSYQAPVLPEGDQYLRIRWGNGKLVGGTYKGSVHLYTLEGEKLSAPEVLMSPTGPTRKEGSLNVNSGAIVMPGGARVMGVAMSGDRPWAVVESGQVFTWDSTGTRITVVDQLDGANALALSPDGTLLAASGNYEAKLWRLEGTKATPAGTLDGLVHVEKYVAVDELLFVGKRALLVGSGNLDKASLVLY
jgi:WD40 repeat protein